jgi:hypothetical protein
MRVHDRARETYAAATPAVQAHASTGKKKMPFEKSQARTSTFRQSLATQERYVNYLLGSRAHVMPQARREGKGGLT